MREIKTRIAEWFAWFCQQMFAMIIFSIFLLLRALGIVELHIKSYEPRHPIQSFPGVRKFLILTFPSNEHSNFWSLWEARVMGYSRQAVGGGLHSSVYLPDSMLRFLKFIFIYFMWDLVNSHQRGNLGAPCMGSVVSQSLGHQGSPCVSVKG